MWCQSTYLLTGSYYFFSLHKSEWTMKQYRVLHILFPSALMLPNGILSGKGIFVWTYQKQHMCMDDTGTSLIWWQQVQTCVNLDSILSIHAGGINKENQVRHDIIVQELCESRGGRPGLSVLTSLLVSVDVKIYCTVLWHWSQLVPNMSHDIWGH